MKISFDYDDTLTKKSMQVLATQLLAEGNEVYIISARNRPERMYRIAEIIGIPRSRVYATGSNRLKVQKVKDLGIDRHYDNNKKVIKDLGRVGKLIV